VAEKIRISGGGRCNFTNRDTTPANFISDNPRFCRSALSRYTPRDFIALLEKHGISPFMKSTRASCFATTRPKTSSRCCWPSVTRAT
jgi:predicted flavoprotein YhiN